MNIRCTVTKSYQKHAFRMFRVRKCINEHILYILLSKQYDHTCINDMLDYSVSVNIKPYTYLITTNWICDKYKYNHTLIVIVLFLVFSTTLVVFIVIQQKTRRLKPEKWHTIYLYSH